MKHNYVATQTLSSVMTQLQDTVDEIELIINVNKQETEGNNQN